MTDESDSGTARVDPKALRRCLGSFATGVAVVTTRHEGRDVGITINSFTSVSLDPPLVLWCLARTSRTSEAFSVSEHFIINILAMDQVDVSNRFAFRSEEAFPAEIAFRRTSSGAPLLEGVSAHVECRRTEAVDGGDHLILIGEVIDFAGSERPGLVYRGGKYAVADAHPLAVSKAGGSLDQGFLDSTVRPALENITRRFESYFDEKLREAGISSRESQILGLLLSRGALNAEQIANMTLVSGSALDETLDTLAKKKLIEMSQQNFELTESGSALASEWYERLQSYRAKALGSIPPEEARALKRTLERLSEWINAAASNPSVD